MRRRSSVGNISLSGTVTRSSRVPDNVQQELSEVLAEALGPLARILVNRHAGSCDDYYSLSMALAEHIDDEDERKQFLGRLDRSLLCRACHTENYRQVRELLFDEVDDNSP